MVALNFQPRFVDDIQSGKKRQTIRGAYHYRTLRAGAPLTLYTKQRTPDCQKLMDTVCASVQRVSLMKTLAQPVGNTVVSGIMLEDFAKADGFETYADMWAFFEPRADENGEFNGVIIRW